MRLRQPNRRRAVFFVALLAVLSWSCRGNEDTLSAAEAEPEFERFSRILFEELRSEPLDTLPLDIGLFGDLQLEAGENAVMGRYRYRVDTAHVPPEALLRFYVRRDGRSETAVPVELKFSGDRGWRYDTVRTGRAYEPSPALNETLDERLAPWVEAAVQRASARVR